MAIDKHMIYRTTSWDLYYRLTMKFICSHCKIKDQSGHVLKQDCNVIGCVDCPVEMETNAT